MSNNRESIENFIVKVLRGSLDEKPDRMFSTMKPMRLSARCRAILEKRLEHWEGRLAKIHEAADQVRSGKLQEYYGRGRA